MLKSIGFTLESDIKSLIVSGDTEFINNLLNELYEKFAQVAKLKRIQQPVISQS